MMEDLTVSENRLIAALDRIDYSIERAAERLRQADRAAPIPATGAQTEIAAPSAPQDAGPRAEPDAALLAELQDLRAENARLTDALAKAEAAADSAQAAAQAELEAMAERLSQQGQEAARLSAAVETLSNANRNLLSRADSGGASADEVRAVLQAELDALRSARAAEISQFSEVLDRLESMLAETGRPGNGRAKRAVAAANDERD